MSLRLLLVKLGVKCNFGGFQKSKKLKIKSGWTPLNASSILNVLDDVIQQFLDFSEHFYLIFLTKPVKVVVCLL